MSRMGKVEKKVLGALLIMANDNMEIKATQYEIATKMGYLRSGGSLSFSLRLLEVENYIEVLGKGHYRVLL